MPLSKLQYLLYLILFLILYVFLIQEINLTNSDIGRHIKNGEIILNSKKVFNTNFYSYTMPNQPVINHHWLSGVLFYLIYKGLGFDGLSLINASLMSLSIIIIALSIEDTNKKDKFIKISLIITLLIPIFQNRLEVRPESISYLFISIYIYIIQKLEKNKIKLKNAFIILTVVQLLWVNFHIFFIFGPIIFSLFIIENIFHKRKHINMKYITFLGAILIIINLFNPSGIQGLLVPFSIFNNFGYRLAENQSVFFMIKFSPKFYYLYFLTISVITLQLILINKVRNLIKWYNLLFLLILILGLRYIRAIPLVTLATIIPLYENFPRKLNKAFIYTLLTISLPLIFINTIFDRNYGIGLLEFGQQSGDFVLKNNIKGPIFNNYDIGSYLIYKLYPIERVYVDNRPEAYNVDFFNNYIDIQNNYDKFMKETEKYDFNLVYFYRHDLTNWGQNFLVNIVRSDDWVPIYYDEFTIIFVKNSSENQEIIDKYKIDKKIFQIKTNT